MKALKLSLFASAMMLGSFTMTAQTADEVMTKHVAAVGGDSWGKLTSMKKVVTMSYQGMEMKMTETKLKGKGMRTDISVMGTENYVIVTPTGAWAYMPMQGATKAEALPDDQLKASLPQMDITDDLVGYKEKGIKAEFVGKEDLNGKPAFKLTLTDKEGNSSTAYFDASTYYKVRETATQQGQEVTTDYSDFKKFPEGVVIAMKSSNAFAEQTISSLELNKPVDEAIFKPSN
ncbi:MAG: hypothetical protein JNL72_11785 [Flavipsychrobacter sp.]|nr:hypothetical protein [Flavipsychrobacter sp.]